MKPEYERTTITVPRELKKRMKKAGQKLNWSAIACEAFEAKLDEMGPIEDITSIEDAIKRIKNIAVERDQDFELAFGEGKDAGTHWALNVASPEQLRRIEELKDKIEKDDDNDSNFKDEMLTPQGRWQLAKCVGHGLEFGEEFFEGPGHNRHRSRRRRGHGGRGHGGRGRGSRRLPRGRWRRGPEGGFEHGPEPRQEDETQLQRWKAEKRIRERMIWRSVLNQRPNHMSFFAGFAAGALEIWDQLKDRLD